MTKAPFQAYLRTAGRAVVALVILAAMLATVPLFLAAVLLVGDWLPQGPWWTWIVWAAFFVAIAVGGFINLVICLGAPYLAWDFLTRGPAWRDLTARKRIYGFASKP